MGKAKRGKNIGFVKEVAKKKPNLQYVLDHIEDLSEQEIQASKIPGWTKQVIIRERDLLIKRQGCISVEEIAQRMIDYSQNETKE
tara:strand:+ start:186 stop:440 length:255 start_codon:yes stop_codon:yes gene_type:complete